MAKVGFDTRAFASFFALVVFAGLVFGGVYAVLNFPQYRSQASAINEPSNIQLVNVTEISMSIFWQTQEPTVGFLSYGTTSQLGRTRTDNRDSETQEQQPYSNHLVSLHSLLPRTKYYYTIGVDSLTFDRAGFPYTFFTNSSIEQRPNNTPVTTRVREPGGSLANDYFVSFTFEDQTTNQVSNVIGSLTRSDGTLELPVADLRTQDGTAGYQLGQGTAYTVEATLYNTKGESDAQTFTYIGHTPFPQLVYGRSVKDQLLLPTESQAPQPPVTTRDSLVVPIATATATRSATPVRTNPPTIKPEVRRLVF